MSQSLLLDPLLNCFKLLLLLKLCLFVVAFHLLLHLICLLLQLQEFLARFAHVILLLPGAHLLEQLLVRLQLHICNHLVLHACFELVALCPGPSLNLLLDLLMFKHTDSLLMRQSCLNRIFNSAYVLKPGNSLHLIHSNALLEEQLHFSAHLNLAYSLSLEDGFLLKPHSFLLLRDLVRLLSQVVQHLGLTFDFFFFVHNLLSNLRLKCNKVIRVAHKLLVTCALIGGGDR